MRGKSHLFRDLALGAKFRFRNRISNDRVYVKVSLSQYAEITTNNTSCTFDSEMNAPEEEVELVTTNFYCDAQVI